jgi:hypothetical protein
MWLTEDAGYSPIARLVSSEIETVGVYNLLIKLSLGENLPAIAIRHAISALSHQHLHMLEKAFLHRAKAVRALQAAVDDPNSSPCRPIQIMAASMLLTIFEVSFERFIL